MERVELRTLSELVEDARSLKSGPVLARQTAEGLAAADERGAV